MKPNPNCSICRACLRLRTAEEKMAEKGPGDPSASAEISSPGGFYEAAGEENGEQNGIQHDRVSKTA
jgi:hypothetical protein